MRRLCLALLLGVWATAIPAQDRETLLIRDVIEREVIVHHVAGEHGAVLVHQSGYDAASWNDVAKRFQNNGITSIAVESTSSEDVLAAMNFLRTQNKSKITLVGSSIGGTSVMQSAQKIGHKIKLKVALLGTADGDLTDLPDTEKLFIVTERDFFSKRSYDAFAKASAPKTFHVLAGQEHGQDMFDGPYGELVFETLLRFILR